MRPGAPPIEIERQVAALERDIVNKRSHLEGLDELARRGKRPPHDPAMLRDLLVGLEAALQTLRSVEANKVAWRECLREAYRSKVAS